MSDLIVAILPRVARTNQTSGITIFRAATSVQSLIYKKLLDKKSDLLVQDMSLSIPAFGHLATLPTDFLSLAERPQTEELIDDWMAGTVTSYNSTTGALAISATSSSGTDTLAVWSLALAALPGTPATNIGSSTTSLVCGTGTKNLTVQTGLTLPTGRYVILSSENSPSGWEGRRHRLEPNYLNCDESHDRNWWEEYGFYGVDTMYYRPGSYRVIGAAIYIHPKPIVDVLLKGKYNQQPVALTASGQTIPWQGKFDEIFTEGVVWIIAHGVATPDADAGFMAFFKREFDSVMDSRASLIPQTRRTYRGNFM